MKISFRGHRKFLPLSHQFRTRKSWFDGKEEHGSAPKIMFGNRIYEHLSDFVNVWGKVKTKKRKRKGDNEPKQMWNKRSIFFELPYWKVSNP